MVFTSGWSERLSSSAALWRAVQAQRSSGKTDSSSNSTAHSSASSQSWARASTETPMLSKVPLLCTTMPLLSACSAIRRQSRVRVPSVSMRPVSRAWPGIGSSRPPARDCNPPEATGEPSTRQTTATGGGGGGARARGGAGARAGGAGGGRGCPPRGAGGGGGGGGGGGDGGKGSHDLGSD